MNTYRVEVTDTYCGEANYSWATRATIRAKSARGAAIIMGRRTGLKFRCVQSYGDWFRYDSASGATCMFIEASED